MLKDLEGETRYMYLDKKGLVTVGIGHMLPNAAEATKLPWYHEKTGLPATPAEVKALFNKLKAEWADFQREHPKAENKQSASQYENLSDLKVPKGFPRQDALDRLQHEFLKPLRGIFPGFDSYPMPAKQAIVDMAYSLGVAKLRDEFPKFVSHCRAGHFADAAPESERHGTRAVRNAATAKLLQDAEELKKSVRTFATEIRP